MTVVGNASCCSMTTTQGPKGTAPGRFFAASNAATFPLDLKAFSMLKFPNEKRRASTDMQQQSLAAEMAASFPNVVGGRADSQRA